MYRSRTILALIAASSLAVATVACSGGGDTYVTTGGPSEGISVTGEGRVSAAPDIATLRLGVRVEAGTVEEAREQAAQLQTAILGSVKDNGVESKDLQTSNFSIQPLYTADPARSIRGYSVTNTLALKVRKLADVSKIIDDATKAGSNNITVQGLSFGLDDPEQVKTEARKLAMDQAKDRAEQTAKNAGVSLGKPISISEGYSGGVYDSAIPMAAAPSTRADTPTPIESGSLDVVVNMQVVYRID
jgi:uncharacterized protein YggE